MEASARGDGLSTQARLMKVRGELGKTSFSFNASLHAPGIHARSKGFGMEVVRAEDATRSSLVVADVDNDPRQATPVAEWNTKEDRHASRVDGEHRLSLAIKPGDKICAVNGMHDDDAMTELLASACDNLSPKPVKLTLERERSDVLGPHSARMPSKSSLPPRLPSNTARHRGRSSSQPAVQPCQARPTSGMSDQIYDAERCRRKSDPDCTRRLPSKSLLPCAQMRGRLSRMEDEASTRSPSVSLSGRSSCGSACDAAPPIVIRATRSHTFARAGFATLGRPSTIQ